MGWEISRRTLLGSLASFAPAAYAAEPPLSLKEDDGDIALLSGMETLWRVLKGDVAASLGSTAQVKQKAQDTLRIENCRLMGDTTCSLDVVLLQPTRELSFVFGFGSNPTASLGRISVSRIREVTWQTQSWLDDWRVRRQLMEKLGRLTFHSGARLGIDSELNVLVLDPQGTTLQPSPLAYQRLRLLPDHARAVWVRGQPLAAAEQPTRDPLQFNAGTWGATTLQVALPANRGETLVIRPASGDKKRFDRGTHAVVWRAHNTETSEGLTLRLQTAAGSPERFPAAPGAGVVWSYGPFGAAQTELEWVLPIKPFALHTRHGRFTVCSGGPGAEATPWPALRTEAVGEQLEHFEATAHLTNFGIKLPDADLGRLDFDYATCAFRLSDCPGATADSIVYLTPSEKRGVDPVALSLDKARLSILRARDHLSVTFKFRHVKLVAGAGAPRLAPGSDGVLVAELPPQHIAEQTFARQLPLLPGLMRDLPAKDLVAARTGTYDEREKVRKSIDGEKDDYVGMAGPGFGKFADEFKRAVANPAAFPEVKVPADANSLPDAVWLGPELVRTAWARRLARAVAAKSAAEVKDKPLPDLPDLYSVPDFFGKKLVAWDLIQRELQGGPNEFPNRAVTAILNEAMRVSDEQRVLQQVYSTWRDEQRKANPSLKLPDRFVTRTGLIQLQKWLGQPPSDPAQPLTVNQAAQQKLDGASTSDRIAKEMQKAYWDEQKKLGTEEPQGRLPVLARLSGFSRLAFSFKEIEEGTQPPRLARIAFTAAALCSWNRFDLKVARRARQFPPTKNAAELVDALKARGIAEGDDTARRLEDIIAATTPPDRCETAIELPFRLILSPSENATFKIASANPPSGDRPQRLWQATLDQGSDSLRAIWSEDFWPDKAFPNKGQRAGEPPRGPWAPWALARDRGDSLKPPLFRGTLDAFDRHQLVGLTSVFGLPVIPRKEPDGRTLHPTQLLPPDSYVLKKQIFRLDRADQALYYPQTLTGPVRPDAKPGTIARPFLALSAAGGFLDVDTTFTPPAALRWDNRDNLFNAFSLGRWQHQIVQGGDVFAQVEYVGFLMPTAHQATLVKLSERVNLLPTSPLVPTSYLMQRHFIRVAKEKTYNPVEAPGMPLACRAWPATKITMRGSLRTPDLVDPSADRPKGPNGERPDSEHPGGRIDLKDATGLIFWPRTARNPNNNVQFTFSIDDAPDVVAMPMIFVDNQAAHDPRTMMALYDYYNGAIAAQKTPTLVVKESLRTLEHRGALRRYANPRKPGDTTLETVRWLVGVDCRNGYLGDGEGFANGSLVTDHFMVDSTLESADQPPFYPRLENATVRLQMIAGLAKAAQPESTFRYPREYLMSGFTADDETKARRELPGDTFFQTVGNRPILDMATQGDRAGGVGRPSQKIVGLARIGPVGNTEAGEGNPKYANVKAPFGKNFFDDKAKLLGLIKLQDLIAKLAGAAAPLLQEKIVYLAGRELRDPVRALARFADELHKSLTPVQNVYTSGFMAVDRLKTVLHQAVDGKDIPSEEDMTEVAAAALRVKVELDAIGAAPLTRLIEITQDQISGVLAPLRIATAKLPFGVDVVPRDLVGRLWPLDFGRLIVGVMEKTRSAMLAARQLPEPRISEIRTKLTGAARALQDTFGPSLAKALLVPLPQNLPDVRRQVAERLKNRIDEITDPMLVEPVGSGLPSPLQYLKDAIDDAAGEAVPAVDAFYLNTVDAVAGKAEKLRDTVIALSSQLTTDVCAAATTVVSALRPLLLPRKADMSACLIIDGCPPPTAGPNFCQPIWQAVCALDQVPEAAAEKTEFIKSSRSLAERFNTLVSLVHDLPESLNVCDPKTVSDWRRVQRARDAFSDELANWAASAVALLRRVSSSTIKDELATVLALATAGAINIVAPGAGTVPSIAEPHKALRDIYGELGASGISAATFIDKVKDLADKLRLLSAAAQGAIEDRLAAVLLPTAAELAKIIPILASGLGAWYDAVATALLQAKALTQKIPDSKIAANLVPQAGKDFEDERRLIGDMVAATTDRVRLEKFGAYLDKVHSDGGFAPIRLVNQAEERFNKVVRETAAYEIMKLVDIEKIRKQLEDQLKFLSPLKRLLKYDYKLDLSTVELGFVSFEPQGDKSLKLTSNTNVNIANGSATSEFTGKTDLFEIHIGERGQFLKLKFGAFEFGGGSGRATTFKAPLTGVAIGPKMAFLAALAAFMGGGKGGDTKEGKPRSGPYIVRRPNGPGIVAGFGLGFDVFSIGAMGFANVFFDAHCELPFDAADSVVRLSLSSREAPMTIFYGVYGGSAYFQVEGDRTGTRRVDVSLEFGGAQAISYGPLKGIGRVMTGIQVTRSGGSGTLTALFTADFVGHIACFGIAACFSVRMSQGAGGVSGAAVLTYSFSCGPAKIKFNITVFRRQSNAGSKEAALLTPFNQPKIMLAQASGLPPIPHALQGLATTMAISPRHDWKASRAYYSEFPDAVGRRRSGT